MSTTYQKIQSVFLRDEQTNYKTFLHGQWSTPEIAYLSGLDWLWTEKVDGTNIRVTFAYDDTEHGYRKFDGRTDKADIPEFLYRRLTEMFDHQLLTNVFFPDGIEEKHIVLYGEGYGARIQKGGGGYIPDGVNFILFDVKINNVWLPFTSVIDIASQLNIPVVPIIGRGTLLEAIEHVKRGYPSVLPGATCQAEGLVCRPTTTLLDRRGERVVTKIKTRDFPKE